MASAAAGAGNQRSGRDWRVRLETPLKSAPANSPQASRLTCYLRQIDDYALFNFPSDDDKFPSGWQPAQHPFACGCTGVDTSLTSGAPSRITAPVTSPPSVLTSPPNSVGQSVGTPNCVGVSNVVLNTVDPRGVPRKKRRASQSHPDRKGVPKCQPDCPKKIRKFVNLDNSTVQTVLDYEKDGEVK